MHESLLMRNRIFTSFAVLFDSVRKEGREERRYFWRKEGRRGTPWLPHEGDLSVYYGKLSLFFQCFCYSNIVSSQRRDRVN